MAMPHEEPGAHLQDTLKTAKQLDIINTFDKLACY